MKSKLQIPVIPEEEQTPVVKGLLALLEQFAERIQEQDEEIARLKDEISILKGEKKRLTFKPSKLDSQTDRDPPGNDESGCEGSDESKKRAGSSKKPKCPPLLNYYTRKRFGITTISFREPYLETLISPYSDTRPASLPEH